MSRKKAADTRWEKKRKAAGKRLDGDSSKAAMPKKLNSNATASRPQCPKDVTAKRPHQDRNAPSPSPSPSPKNKNNPGTAPGNFSNFDKKVKSKTVSKKVKPKNVTKDTTGYFQNINQACLQICKLPPKQKAFNPYQWAQKQIIQNAHPGAVAESLDGLALLWPSADSPWGYADTILKTKNGNWNEADAIKIHQKMKALKPKALEEFTYGLFKNVKD